MSIYNDYTKNADVSVKLIERNEQSDKSVWGVTLNRDITKLGRTDEKILKSGAIFKCEAEYDVKEDDVLNYVHSRGLLDACSISDAEFEGLLEEDDRTVEIAATELRV